MAITSIPAWPSTASLRGRPLPPRLRQKHGQGLLTPAHGDVPHTQRNTTATCEMCFLKETRSPSCRPPKCSPHSPGQEEKLFQVGHGEGGESPSRRSPSIPMLPTNTIAASRVDPSSPVSSRAWRVVSIIIVIIVSFWDELCNSPRLVSFFLSPLSRKPSIRVLLSLPTLTGRSALRGTAVRRGQPHYPLPCTICYQPSTSGRRVRRHIQHSKALAASQASGDFLGQRD